MAIRLVLSDWVTFLKALGIKLMLFLWSSDLLRGQLFFSDIFPDTYPWYSCAVLLPEGSCMTWGCYSHYQATWLLRSILGPFFRTHLKILHRLLVLMFWRGWYDATNIRGGVDYSYRFWGMYWHLFTDRGLPFLKPSIIQEFSLPGSGLTYISKPSGVCNTLKDGGIL